MKLRTVIVEDEPLAREYLAAMLEERADIELVGMASDGDAALELIGREQPDLAFLDIQMPGVSGVEVLRRASPTPWAVFTTAFDHHAATAFELNAVDYILKPFGPERLGAALDRVQARAAVDRSPNGQVERVDRALDAGSPIDRVFVESRGRITPLLLEAVEHVQAQGDYVELRTGNGSHLLRVPLRRFVERLDAQVFLQVHRSHVVNLDRVRAFAPLDDGRLEIELQSGNIVIASRSRTPQLRARLRDP